MLSGKSFSEKAIGTNICSKGWLFLSLENYKTIFLRPYRELEMFKWPAKDLGCSEGADWTMDWRQTFIVQNSIFKLPPITGLCQCWTKCLLSRTAKEFSLVTPFLSARKKAQRYIDRDRGSCSSSTAGHSLWRQKGPIVSSESGMQEGKTIQGLTPGFGTEVPVAGRGCVTSIMWAERTLGHRG